MRVKKGSFFGIRGACLTVLFGGGHLTVSFIGLARQLLDWGQPGFRHRHLCIFSRNLCLYFRIAF
jgi:hypothetical protein